MSPINQTSTSTAIATTTSTANPSDAPLDYETQCLLKEICWLSLNLDTKAEKLKENLFTSGHITRMCNWYTVTLNPKLMGKIS